MAYVSGSVIGVSSRRPARRPVDVEITRDPTTGEVTAALPKLGLGARGKTEDEALSLLGEMLIAYYEPRITEGRKPRPS